MEEKNPCNLSAETLQDLHTLDSFTNLSEIRKRDKNWNKDNYDEPSLLDVKTETYRFIWHNSFGGFKVYRIEERAAIIWR